ARHERAAQDGGWQGGGGRRVGAGAGAAHHGLRGGGGLSAARTRLSRTVAMARWAEYRRLLEMALRRGYRVRALEDWVLESPQPEAPELILRHDVDQHPRSALAMASIELDVGVRSTWYFRWRTAHPVAVGRLRESGFGVGLHYETLSRLALEGRNG